MLTEFLVFSKKPNIQVYVKHQLNVLNIKILEHNIENI